MSNMLVTFPDLGGGRVHACDAKDYLFEADNSGMEKPDPARIGRSA